VRAVKPNVIAVLDVGKTNKKLRVYNRQFEVLAEQRTTLDVRFVDDVEVDAADDLLEWTRGALKAFAADYDIRAIAVTTHGATCALLDEAGALAFPVISYTCERGAEIQDEFYATFGDREALHLETSTADFGFANLAKVFFFVKTRMPEVWAKVRHAVFFDSYIGYRLTGQLASEMTYLGNHSYFWRYKDRAWSSVAKALGADTLFPERLLKPWEALGTVTPEVARACGLSEDCPVTCGIHDSNANYLPYLAKGQGDFILNSTGTWCVAMKGAAAPELSQAEIASKLFFNMDALGYPVLTALFPGGMEYGKFRGFTTLKDESNLALVEWVLAEKDLFVVPGALPDAQVFPGAKPKVVYKGRAYSIEQLEAGEAPIDELGQTYNAALNLGLAIGSQEMMGRLGAGRGTTIIIEGGFANNRPYCQVLASLCPESTIALTNMKEGTSFGAALTGWMLAEGLSLEAIGREFAIEMTPVKAEVQGDLAGYVEAWRSHLQ